MIKPILAVLLFTVFAQAFPSCGGGEPLVGWVEQKIMRQSGQGVEYIIIINAAEYLVPAAFWRTVEVGDLVKQEADGRWVIVRKRGT